MPENSKEPLQNEIEPSSAPLAEVKPEAEIKSTISEVPESQNFGMDFINPSESQSENQLPPATFSENNYLNQHEPGATNYLDNNFLSTNQEQQAQEMNSG